jgi:hypothetical protein
MPAPGKPYRHRLPTPEITHLGARGGAVCPLPYAGRICYYPLGSGSDFAKAKPMGGGGRLGSARR